MIVVKKTAKRWINSINRIIIHLGLNGKRFVSLLFVPCLQAIIASSCLVCWGWQHENAGRRFNFFIWGCAPRSVRPESAGVDAFQLVWPCQTHVHTEKAIKKRLSLSKPFRCPIQSVNKNIVNHWWGFTNLLWIICKTTEVVNARVHWWCAAGKGEKAITWKRVSFDLCLVQFYASCINTSILCSCLRKLERTASILCLSFEHLAGWLPSRKIAQHCSRRCLSAVCTTFTFEDDPAWFWNFRSGLEVFAQVLHSHHISLPDQIFISPRNERQKSNKNFFND